MLRRLEYNAPVALSFALLSLLVLFLGWVTADVTTLKLFCVYASPWSDPLTYIRLFGHVLGHSGLSHYMNNMMLLLLLGPIVEETYGSSRLLLMMLVTAAVTGLITMIFFPNTALLGASGIVFLMIILASLGSSRKHARIPITFLAVAVLYLGQEVYNLFFSVDNISQLAHLIGGGTGLVFGLSFRRH